MNRVPTPPTKLVLPTLPQLRETTVFGQKICYYDAGQGPPLVFVHGVGGEVDQLAFLFDALATPNRIIALDVLGFGRPDKPLTDYRVAAFALWFPERVDRLVLNDAAGIDEGGCGIPVDLNIPTRTNLHVAFEGMFHDKDMVTEELVDLAYTLHLQRGDGYAIRSVLETLAHP